MSAALTNLSALSGDHKTVIIGDMFELGPETALQHQQIVAMANRLNFERLIFIGENFYAFKEQFSGEFFRTRNEASVYLSGNAIKNSLVLLKGSRGMALEQLLPLL